MIILGLDPGTAIVGYALIKKEGHKLEALEYGCIRTKAGMKDEERLLGIEKELKKIIKRFKPEESAVEKLFFFKNLTTVMTVSQARGVILATLAKAGLKIFEYTPLQAKSAVAGYGKAPKMQVQRMVKNILGLVDLPRPDDAADALAIAICHANQRRLAC